MRLVIIKEAAEFDLWGCVCVHVCWRGGDKHIKLTQCNLDNRTNLGWADDGKKQMVKRQTNSQLVHFLSDAQIISLDSTMERDRKGKIHLWKKEQIDGGRA